MLQIVKFSSTVELLNYLHVRVENKVTSNVAESKVIGSKLALLCVER